MYTTIASCRVLMQAEGNLPKFVKLDLALRKILLGKRLLQADLGNTDRMCARALCRAVLGELDQSLAWH